VTDLPGIGGQLIKLKLTNNWFVPGDIIMSNTASPFTSDASQYYVERRGDKLIACDIQTGEPKIELIETGPVETVKVEREDYTFSYKPLPGWDPVYDDNGYRYDKLANAFFEKLPPKQLEPKMEVVFLDFSEPATTNAI
jgi:hypothetical protein